MRDSKIEWTHHTFNPWWGCQRVSPGCEHCYAETFANRLGFKVWGPAKTTARRMASATYWQGPIAWNKAARDSGERQRVFCASMADVFEDHPDVVESRARLFALIDATPYLDWLLLTKRPENVNAMLGGWKLSANVWMGTSVEDQRRANERIPALLDIPARVRFLSCEPLLGPVDIGAAYPAMGPMTHFGFTDGFGYEALLHWVIAGGESGPKARPMNPAWARSLRDQCVDAGVAFHFKQWGEYAPRLIRPPVATADGLEFSDKEILTRMGKKDAGRMLDGRTWDEVPA